MFIIRVIENECPPDDKPFVTEFVVGAPEEAMQKVISLFVQEKEKIDADMEEYEDLGWYGRVSLAMERALTQTEYRTVECGEAEIYTD
ncbi:MAG: hypothetical protein IJ716_14065 [Lachnospiraceae bacterium]|nr:hypothetical protein [Lachnospiraceae bacterium]MBR1905433.1 hypothetical protein [Clostridiales bacterium]